MDKSASHQRKVGLIGLTSLVLIFLASTVVNWHALLHPSIKLYAVQPTALDLPVKTPVSINGVQIGKVSKSIINGEQSVIELSIKRSVKLSKRAQFITKLTVFWNKEIYVENANSETNFYQHGDTLQKPILEKSTGPIDSNLVEGIKPLIKELSKSVGAALIEFSEAIDTVNR